MSYTLISNPPYNIKWKNPPFAQIQPRFNDCGIVPPENNANFAFILQALNFSNRAVLILPNSVLTTSDKKESYIRKYLIEKNYIETVITCPDGMFESTKIAVCIIVFDKSKTTTMVEMINLMDMYETEIREQCGQCGGESHTKRVYKKECKIFTDEIIEYTLNCIKDKKSIKGNCKSVSIEDIRNEKYILMPSFYIDVDFESSTRYRPYSEIVNDLNKIVREKNACKLTINETIAKSLGFKEELYYKIDDDGLNNLLLSFGADKLEKDNYFKTTKNKNEIKFENADKEILSSILVMILNTWKQHIYYLNNEENKYLSELRDTLLQDIMSGKMEQLESIVEMRD